MRGIVLLESLKNERLPESLRPLVVREYSHYLGRPESCNICRLEFDRSRSPMVAFDLAREIKPKESYAHLVDDTVMHVIFPLCVVTILRADPESLEIARSIGQNFEIPRRYMRFDEMFELDHPEMHSEFKE